LTQSCNEVVFLGDERCPVRHAAFCADAIEAHRRARLMHALHGADQRLGRNAADVDARPADGAMTDERDVRALLRRRDGG
jgi:hypothetical protein